MKCVSNVSFIHPLIFPQQYRGRYGEIAICKYNSGHRHPASDMAEHYESCPDRPPNWEELDAPWEPPPTSGELNFGQSLVKSQAIFISGSNHTYSLNEYLAKMKFPRQVITIHKKTNLGDHGLNRGPFLS